MAPPTTPGTVPGPSYAIEGGELGKRRLDLVAEVMRPSTLRLFRKVGLGPGQRCLDAGCGGGHVTRELARIVGPTGKVVGIDFDPKIVELARAGAADDGYDNVELLVADARTVDGGPFDLVYGRFLLSHLSRCEEVLARLSQLACPGGSVVIEDVDFSGSFCHPANPAYDRYLQLYIEVVAQVGGDATLGRRLPRLLIEAGLEDVTWNIFQLVHSAGPYKELENLTLERIRPALVRQGLASSEEVDEILLSMRRFAADPSTLVSLPRIVQAWGRVG